MFPKTPQSQRGLRQQTIAAASVLSSGEGEIFIQLLRRLACQTDGAWIWLELADTVSEDIKAYFASEKGPRGSRQKFTKARVVNGGVLIEK